MGILTCIINPFWEKQLIKNDYTNEELWVESNKVPEVLHSLLLEKTHPIKGVWLEGPYIECETIRYKYCNKYPEDNVPFTIN